MTFTGSGELLDTYTSTYFEIAPTVWEKFSNEIAMQILTGLYPSWNVSTEALALADSFLATGHAGGLQRVVSEERDRVARALRNREVDAG